MLLPAGAAGLPDGMLGHRVPVHSSMRSQAGCCLQACLATGWDIVGPDEAQFSEELWELLAERLEESPVGRRFELQRGQVLQGRDQPSRVFFLVAQVGQSMSPSASEAADLNQPDQVLILKAQVSCV